MLLNVGSFNLVETAVSPFEFQAANVWVPMMAAVSCWMFLSEEKASTSFFIARISPWWTTDVLLAKECRRHFNILWYAMILYEVILILYNIMILFCHLLRTCTSVLQEAKPGQNLLYYKYIQNILPLRRNTPSTTWKSVTSSLLHFHVEVAEAPPVFPSPPGKPTASCEIRLEDKLFLSTLVN